jgi:signal transduction histidine kinase
MVGISAQAGTFPRLWVRARDAARAHTYTSDALLALFLYLVMLITPAVHQSESIRPDRSTLLLGPLIFGPLIVRRRWPGLVLAISSVATIAYIVLGHARGPMLFGAAVAAYTFCVRRERVLSLTVGTICASVIGLASMTFSPDVWDSEVNGVAFAWIGLAVAVGEAMRTRRAFVVAMEERALRAEQTREDEARRRVMEERLRIARELHDIVGHHIALINVQAGVASHVLETQPEQARQALAHVREAGRTALSELSATVSVLRQGDDPEACAPVEPVPGLDRVPALLESFRRAGLEVELEVRGRARPVPASVDLAAYRVVQESLTNVRKHAGAASAAVLIGYERRLLRVEVCNECANAAPPEGGGTGHGIIGMRERAVAVGGTFRAGPLPDGGFSVAAELPLVELPGRDRSRAVARAAARTGTTDGR